MILPATESKIEMQAQIGREGFYCKGIRKKEKHIYDKEDNFFQIFFFLNRMTNRRSACGSHVVRAALAKSFSLHFTHPALSLLFSAPCLLPLCTYPTALSSLISYLLPLQSALALGSEL